MESFAYAPGRHLDLYPPTGGEPPWPLLVWTGGSGWLLANGRDRASAIAEEFTTRGFAVAGVTVRSSRQARFPGQLHDIKAAIRWLRARADEFHLDGDRFAIMGDSSGGWTAAMAALTADRPDWEGDEGVTGVSSRVRVGVAFYPPTQFLVMDEQMTPDAYAGFNKRLGLAEGHNDPLSPESRLIGGPIQEHPETVLAASPLSYATASATPILLLHGQADALVPHGQSVLLYQALRDHGATATLYSVPDVGHDWPALLDPANHGRHTVYQAHAGEERVTIGTPGPTWDTIEEFIRQAFA